jgi:hypothetical protein
MVAVAYIRRAVRAILFPPRRKTFEAPYAVWAARLGRAAVVAERNGNREAAKAADLAAAWWTREALVARGVFA